MLGSRGILSCPALTYPVLPCPVLLHEAEAYAPAASEACASAPVLLLATALCCLVLAGTQCAAAAAGAEHEPYAPAAEPGRPGGSYEPGRAGVSREPGRRTAGIAWHGDPTLVVVLPLRPTVPQCRPAAHAHGQGKALPWPCSVPAEHPRAFAPADRVLPCPLPFVRPPPLDGSAPVSLKLCPCDSFV